QPPSYRAFIAGWQEGAGEEAGELIASLRQEAEAVIDSEVETGKLAEKATVQLFDAPFWEDVSFACINCGTCTYLCPTCWCFDIQDEVLGREGVRMRNWDSCMYSLFTLHGSGHNPRSEKVQRVRQRFMHKLKYYVDKYESGIQCVGCGRCIQHCPVNIDIRRVCALMNRFEPGNECAV
ncbi:4Fe-4S dicluster domain-containing protein, partial [Thermodesulfobacteriota bacterium]